MKENRRRRFKYYARISLEYTPKARLDRYRVSCGVADSPYQQRNGPVWGSFSSLFAWGVGGRFLCDMAIKTKQWTFGVVRGRDETGLCSKYAIWNSPISLRDFPSLSFRMFPQSAPKVCDYRATYFVYIFIWMDQKSRRNHIIWRAGEAE